MKASIVLEDGAIFEGESFGFEGEAGGEVVFNTSVTGYQEILTDPSYKGQIIVMTYPQIGNYGVNSCDVESDRCSLEGMIVKEYSSSYSNHRAQASLGDYLKENRVIGITNIETRNLTLRIRETGAMRGYAACGEFSREYLLSKVRDVPSMAGLNLADAVSCRKSYEWDPQPKGNRRIAVIDCGVKFNILRNLRAIGADVTVFSSGVPCEELLESNPHGVLISNGPGDPAAVTGVIKTTERILGKLPLFGICLGHQILALALGAKTYKLKFGHRGANHPVKNLKSGSVEITSQNHGFAVDAQSLHDIDEKRFGRVELSHLNLNDGTVEGIECPDIGAFSVQYHPEASPGPHDANYLFAKFAAMTE